MKLIIAVAIVSALLAAALARWTRIHPLIVAFVLAAIAMGAATVVAAEFMSPVAIAAGAIFGVISGASATFDGFLGRLRRMHVEKM